MGFLTSIEVVCSITPCEGFTFLEGENKISFSNKRDYKYSPGI